ncbi:hypothetical protein L1D14_03755, partial [Vibrio tubiashii]|uniref:hypothetical protein n=1 Tax=Vibrio tubiashii TaxID=29498 RepID=UPI001EFCEF38
HILKSNYLYLLLSGLIPLTTYDGLLFGESVESGFAYIISIVFAVLISAGMSLAMHMFSVLETLDN